jgi:hypothetical protein
MALERYGETGRWNRWLGIARKHMHLRFDVTQPHCPHTDSRLNGNKPKELIDHHRPENSEFPIFAGPWLSRAKESAGACQWLEALIYLWVSFNAWLGLAINDRNYSDNDSYLWKAAGQDPDFVSLFDHSLQCDEEFAQDAHQFHELWPVFKARSLADLGIEAWGAWGSNEPRHDYRRRVFANGLDWRDYSPPCFLEHLNEPEALAGFYPGNVPLDWEHTLAAIYMVRCNLFHGGKSFLNAKDRKFVLLSYKLLSQVWWMRLCDA